MTTGFDWFLPGADQTTAWALALMIVGVVPTWAMERFAGGDLQSRPPGTVACPRQRPLTAIGEGNRRPPIQRGDPVEHLRHRGGVGR
ncbi:MAG: hypothetical protein R3E83_00420 [Burkholderiaceae bacterium]